MPEAVKHRTYELSDWRSETLDSYRATVYVAGDPQVCAKVCREFCLRVGACVTLKPCDYIYTGGAESGVEVGFIQYPPFPASTNTILERALALGQLLAEANSQWSYTVVGTDETVFRSRRKRKD